MEIPLRLALNYPETRVLFVLDLIITMIFCGDILVQMLPARAKNHTLRIDREYLKSWFAVDFLAGFPFPLLIGAEIFGSFHTFKLFRLLRLLRLLKLPRIIHLMHRYQKISFISPSAFRILLFVVLLTLIVHWFSCGWLILGPELTEGERVTRYINALYWVITTMTTVGYGDITPKGNVQTLYALLVMVVGVGTWGYFIANVANLIGHIDMSKMDFSKRLDTITAFFASRDVPEKLQKRIREYYHYIWENRLDHDENEMLSDLPDSLRNEISLLLRKSLIDKAPIFERGGKDFSTEVVTHLNVHVFYPATLSSGRAIPETACTSSPRASWRFWTNPTRRWSPP